MLVVLLTTILLITPNSLSGDNLNQPRLTEHRKTGQSDSTWARTVLVKAYCNAYAVKWDVKPEFVLAVAHIESRKGNHEFRVGRAGRYWLPMGIHNCFLQDRGWPVDTLSGNIEAGARALRGIQTMDQLKQRLKKYNASFTSSYWGAVTKAVNKYREEGR